MKNMGWLGCFHSDQFGRLTIVIMIIMMIIMMKVVVMATELTLMH